MAKPYRLPLRSNSVDVVVSGQAFEHIPFVWVSITEIARVLRRGGHR
jgi:ubiquinone/menaquinone biosynthesis C-methylase UbiE